MSSDAVREVFSIGDLLAQREFDLRVMFDTVINSDAIFIHGRDDLYREMLVDAALLFHAGTAKTVVINGLTAKQCEEKNLAYHGCEEWQRILGSYGLTSDNIKLLAPSEHTGLESRNLMELSREMGWEKLIVMAVPYHIQRCMLQAVACMKNAWMWLDISAFCSKMYMGIDWDRPVIKKLLGGGEESGRRGAHAAAEAERAIKYAHLGDGFISNSTYAEGIGYFEERNLRRRENKAG